MDDVFVGSCRGSRIEGRDRGAACGWEGVRSSFTPLRLIKSRHARGSHCPAR